jgi:hypothetical protein
VKPDGGLGPTTGEKPDGDVSSLRAGDTPEAAWSGLG